MTFKLNLKTPHPVFLSLTGTFKPEVVCDFGAQAFNNSCQRELKTPPVRFGTQGVHGVTFNTAVAFQPKMLEVPGKIASSKAVPPKVSRRSMDKRPAAATDNACPLSLN